MQKYSCLSSLYHKLSVPRCFWWPFMFKFVFHDLELSTSRKICVRYLFFWRNGYNLFMCSSNMSTCHVLSAPCVGCPRKSPWSLCVQCFGRSSHVFFPARDLHSQFWMVLPSGFALAKIWPSVLTEKRNFLLCEKCKSMAWSWCFYLSYPFL